MSEEHDVEMWQRAEAEAEAAADRQTLKVAEEWVADLLDDYGLGRPDSLHGGLDQIGEAFRLADWLHAEQEWTLREYYSRMKALAASRQAAGAEVERLRDGWRKSDQFHSRKGFEHLQEIERLRREVEFEANGADTFAGADAIHGGGEA